MHENMIGGGMLNNWLAIVGVISLMYWAWRIFAAFQHRAGEHPATARPTGGPAGALPMVTPAHLTVPTEDIPVIAAAVYAMLGRHRIVHLEPVDNGQAWALEGRWAQQTSHTPR